MLPNSSDSDKQLNIPIRSGLKDEIVRQAKQSGSTIKEFVEQILERFIDNSTFPDELTHSEPQQLPQHNLYSIHDPMHSQFSLDQVLQSVIERLNRVERHCCHLAVDIQELQVLKNYQPLLNKMDRQMNFSMPEQNSSLIACEPIEDTNKSSCSGNKGLIAHSPEVYSGSIADLNQSAPKTKTKVSKTSAASFNKKKASKYSTSVISEFSEWMTVKEAHEFACQQGYNKKIECFRRISHSADFNQQYAQWGLSCDLDRKESSQKNNKYFRRLSELEKQSL